MESNIDEFSEETHTEDAIDCFHNGRATNDPNRKCETSPCSETSNLVSLNSSYEFLSENLGHNATSQKSGMFAASEDNTMLQTFDKQKALEGHDDNMSCLILSNESDKFPSFGVNCQQDVSNLLRTAGLVPGSVYGDPSADALDCLEKNEGFEKVTGSVGLPSKKDSNSQSHPVEESDDSDIVEHDVKVCDICGDAGREDLLAICCRCTDGAEHTYCMREMLNKVPEGDWLCEECKIDEEMRSQQQDRSYSSGQAGTVTANISVKSETVGSDIAGNKVNKDRSTVKITSKRYVEDAEVSSAVKKQAIEPNVGSSKAPSPSRIASLSRENSFRNLDKGKVKPSHQLFSSTVSSSDASDMGSSSVSGARMQSPRGTFLKSNSFNSLNAKPKVKLVDEVIPLKPRSARDPTFMKEGSIRSIGKSMSFKSINTGRLTSSESKVKMLSPKVSQVQDVKGLKTMKERSSFEKKNSFKFERPLVNSAISSSAVATSKIDHVNHLSSSYETKAAQLDSRSLTALKASTLSARRIPEMPVTLDETKRQPTYLSNVVGVPSISRISNSEQKPIQVSPKEESLPGSCISERLPSNTNGSLLDGSYKPKESSNSGEIVRESCGYRLRQNANGGGRPVSCQKCKEAGHVALDCTADSPESSALDASALKSSREIMNGTSKLKAAIEAALLRKPELCRKQRVSEQSDDLPASGVNCGMASENQVQIPVGTRNVYNAEEMHDGPTVLHNYAMDSIMQENLNNRKQFNVIPVETSASRPGDAGPKVVSDGKSSRGDLSHQNSAVESTMLKIAIPEHEHIWQGGFEVRRSGRTVNVCDGIQAHLSTCASSKVLEAVNKFPDKVLLNEVPRSSAWPIQFQDYGVTEDNIALFFFAKDLGSYEKSYKVLLENMMKNDLALQGNIGTLELLIFPSNQLPGKSQRWNMLFFLWAVLRGRKLNRPGSIEQYFVPKDIPVSVMCLSKNVSSQEHAHEDLSVFADVTRVSEASFTKESPHLSLVKTVKVDYDTKASSQVSNVEHTQATADHLDRRMDSNSSSMLQSTSDKSYQKMRPTASPSEVVIDSKCKLDQELQASAQDARRIGGPNRKEQLPIKSNIKLDDQLTSHCVKQLSFGCPSEGLILRETKDRMGMSLGGLIDKGSPLRQLNQDKCQQADSAEIMSRAASAGTMQSSSNNLDDTFVDRIHAHEKWKNGFIYCGVTSSSSVMEKGHDESLSETATSGSAERYFFPVDPYPAKDIDLVGEATPCKMNTSKEYQLCERAPNLELALGAETKPSMQEIPPFLVGKVDKKVVQDQQSGKATTENDEDDMSASLSLSLSFPFSDREKTLKSIPKVEQLIPERRHVNTSLLLFEGLRDK